MNKKGFTLAELLGVIVIIGLLLLLIIPLIINGVKSKEDDVEQTQNNIIFDAVDEYLDLDKDKYPNIPGNIYCITLNELIESGKLVDPVKKIVEDGNIDPNYTIEIIISKDGVREYSVSEGECKSYTSKNIEMVIDPSNSKWSRDKEVTIYYPEECGEEYTCTYKKDNGETQTVTSGKIATVNFDKNGTIYANMKGKSEIEKKQKVEKIDIENPKIEKVNPVKPWTMNYTQQINIILTDAHSGVGGYCIKQNTTKPDKNDSCFKTVNFPAYGGTGTVTVLLPKGKYYIFVKDRVGNVSNYDPNNKNLTFEVKDEVKPKCTVTSPNNTVNGWFNKNFTVKVNTSDDYSGVRAWDLTLSPNPTYNNVTSLTHTKDTSGTTYYGYVEDRAGNKNKCYGTFKKDTAGPIFQGGGEVSTGSVNPVIFHDSLSGMNRVEYIFSNSSDTPSPNDAWSGTTTGTTDCGNTIYVFAKGTDNAENYTIVPLGSYNTGSCVPRNSCNIRGDTIISAYSWTCSGGHRHTTAYRRYCSDSEGNIYPATSVSSGGPGQYVCPTRPFTEADGWYIIEG